MQDDVRANLAGQFDVGIGSSLVVSETPRMRFEPLPARRIASGSNALCPATADMLAADSAAGRLVALDFDAPYLRTDYGVITLADRSPAPATAAFLAVLRHVEEEIAEAESATTAGVREGGSRSRRRASERAPVTQGVSD